MLENQTKKCTKCTKTKDFSEFGKSKSHKDGMQYWCKSCSNKNTLEYQRTKLGLVARIYAHQRHSSKRRLHELPNYSKNQLKDWLFNQDAYHELHDKWVMSGYDTELKPSCDRKDDYLPYSFDNIEIKTWKENKDKSHTDRKNGVNRKGSKSVTQLSIDGVFIAEFFSQSEAERKTGVHQSNITNACNGILKTAGGFKWAFSQ